MAVSERDQRSPWWPLILELNTLKWCQQCQDLDLNDPSNAPICPACKRKCNSKERQRREQMEERLALIRQQELERRWYVRSYASKDNYHFYDDRYRAYEDRDGYWDINARELDEIKYSGQWHEDDWIQFKLRNQQPLTPAEARTILKRSRDQRAKDRGDK